MRKVNNTTRLFPVVLVAAGFLVLFKIANLAFNGTADLAAVSIAAAQDSKAEPKNQPASAKPADAATLKAPASTPESDKKTPPKPVKSKLRQPGSSETLILQRLADRRKALEKRAKALDLRVNLIKTAEKKVEQRIKELKAIEARIEKNLAGHDKKKAAQLKNLVAMYENMKPKDAARIFNRLDLNVVTDVAEQMSSRKMAPVLARMDSAAAERLTLELVARARNRIDVTQKEKLPKVRSGGNG